MSSASGDSEDSGYEELRSYLEDPTEGLFKSQSGSAISFCIRVKERLKKKLIEEIISAYGGTVEGDVSDLHPKTAVIFEEQPKKTGDRPAFKLSYIIDCIQKNELLDISKYAFRPTPHAMNVIYFRTENFSADERNETLTDDALFPPPEPSNSPKKSKVKVNKHSKAPYTMNEKENILKFLIRHKKFTELKGSNIWRTMEARDVCPRRTYQSMKEHFCKTMIHELDRYEFLSEKEKDNLLSGYYGLKKPAPRKVKSYLT